MKICKNYRKRRRLLKSTKRLKNANGTPKGTLHPKAVSQPELSFASKTPFEFLSFSRFILKF
jgi:hypothetical protein